MFAHILQFDSNIVHKQGFFILIGPIMKHTIFALTDNKKLGCMFHLLMCSIRKQVIFLLLISCDVCGYKLSQDSTLFLSNLSNSNQSFNSL